MSRCRPGIAPRSSLELFVAGLQSIGSWRGFLGYAAVGGAVVWLGLVTNTLYLLVGAMLIAPFAGPAVNTAIATARGDFELLWHSLLRYGAALGVTAVVTALLSLLSGQQVATETMAAVSTISAAAVLLPLTAGAAGALHLCQGEQSSLVSGAATGMLIAASLAPPAGLLGMTTVSGDYAMLPPALFLLGLQLVGINLGGAAVFHLFGLTPRGARYKRGRARVRCLSLLLTGMGLAALLAWQFGAEPPALRHATIEQKLRDAVLASLAADGSAAVVEANLRFTRADIPGQHSLLAILYALRQPRASGSDAELRERASTRRASGATRACGWRAQRSTGSSQHSAPTGRRRRANRSSAMPRLRSARSMVPTPPGCCSRRRRSAARSRSGSSSPPWQQHASGVLSDHRLFPAEPVLPPAPLRGGGTWGGRARADARRQLRPPEHLVRGEQAP